jgi:hypothetical protein
MSACPPITFSDVTEEKYQSLVATAQAQGLSLVGVKGDTSYQGLDFTWHYDAATQTLTIHCTGKPIFVPCSMIESRIRGLIA